MSATYPYPEVRLRQIASDMADCDPKDVALPSVCLAVERLWKTRAEAAEKAALTAEAFAVNTRDAGLEAPTVALDRSVEEARTLAATCRDKAAAWHARFLELHP